VIIEDFLLPSFCKEIKEQIDFIIEAKDNLIWKDEQDSDKRIYFAENLGKEYKDFLWNREILGVLKDYLGVINPSCMLLASRLEFVPGNLGSGGGWHRDSPTTHQFKALVYLEDTLIDNGPFQYFEGSHRKTNVLKNLLNGIFLPGQYRFSEDQILGYQSKNANVKLINLTATAGTLVLVDTKGIHRGMPIKNGRRYSLFNYYWGNHIPSHIKSLNKFS
jgi:hypothetical protein